MEEKNVEYETCLVHNYDEINLEELVDFFKKEIQWEKKSKDKINTRKKMLKVFCVRGHESLDEQLITAYTKVMNQSRESSGVAREWLSEEDYATQIREERTTDRELFKNNIISSGGVYERFFGGNFTEEQLEKMFYRLVAKCKTPFFSEEELERLRQNLISKKYADILYKVMFHAFRSASWNLRHIYCDKLYQESLTLRVDNPLKDQILKFVADKGVGSKQELAALEYGMRVYERESLEEGMRYFIKGGVNEAALWSIAFQLEKKWEQIKDDLYEEVKKHVDSHLKKVKRNEFYIEVVPTSKDEKRINRLKLATKIYIYLCDECFAKAYNSIGKLLLIGEIRVKEEQEQIAQSNNVDYYPLSRATAFRFLKQAYKLGNPHAMVNMARYWLNRCKREEILERLIKSEKNEDKKREYEREREIKKEIWMDARRNEERAKRWMKAMAEMHECVACEYYGQILEEEGNYKEALKYYEYAALQKSENAALAAAKLYEHLGENENARRHYISVGKIWRMNA